MGDAEQPGRLLRVEEVGRADETGDERRGRSVVDLLRSAHLFDATFVEHRDPGAHRQRLTLVVGDEHERDADGVLDRLELDLHLLAELEVERAERLVEQQHAGLVDQRPGERDALTLPAAQLIRATFAELAEADDVEHLAGATTTLGPTDAFHLEPVLDVLTDGHVGEQRVVLEHRVDVAVVRRDVGHVLAGEQDRTRRRLLEAGDHPQHRRLAGAGRAEQREELAGLDRQRDTVDGRRRRRTPCGPAPARSRAPPPRPHPRLSSRSRLSPAPPVVAVQTVAPSPSAPGPAFRAVGIRAHRAF